MLASQYNDRRVEAKQDKDCCSSRKDDRALGHLPPCPHPVECRPIYTAVKLRCALGFHNNSTDRQEYHFKFSIATATSFQHRSRSARRKRKSSRFQKSRVSQGRRSKYYHLLETFNLTNIIY